MTEAKLQAAVQRDLDRAGIKWWHVPRGAAKKRAQLADIPDLVCLGAGKCFFIELKRPGGKLRPGQARFLQSCTANGVLGCVVSSLDEWGIVRAVVCGS